MTITLSDRLPLSLATDTPISGPPTSAQLKKINALVPQGFDALLAEEVFVVTGCISDNLVNRSYSRWSAQALQDLQKLIVNVPATLNHEWENVDKVWGRTFEAVTTVTPYDQVPKSLMDRAGNLAENRKIVKAEGLVRCYASAFTSIDHPILGQLRFAQAAEISTGGLSYLSIHCPLCSTEFGTEGCGHYPPHPFFGHDPNDKNEAPFYIRTDLFDALEFSLVVTPNLPNAGVV